MASQNQGNTAIVTRTLAYDNPSYFVRQSSQLTTVTASGGLSSKFYAFAQLQLYGVTAHTLTAGTSTYTVNGTTTAQATQWNLIHIYNTSSTTVSLATDTVGPFTIGGTATTGANVSVGGIGGVAGGYQGPFCVNTMGGTNTTQTWGGTTFTQSPAGGGNAGIGGMPLAVGDVVYIVHGTDTTASVLPVLQYSIQPPNGQVIA